MWRSCISYIAINAAFYLKLGSSNMELYKKYEKYNFLQLLCCRIQNCLWSEISHVRSQRSKQERFSRYLFLFRLMELQLFHGFNCHVPIAERLDQWSSCYGCTPSCSRLLLSGLLSGSTAGVQGIALSRNIQRESGYWVLVATFWASRMTLIGWPTSCSLMPPTTSTSPRCDSNRSNSIDPTLMLAIQTASICCLQM